MGNEPVVALSQLVEGLAGAVILHQVGVGRVLAGGDVLQARVKIEGVGGIVYGAQQLVHIPGGQLHLPRLCLLGPLHQDAVGSGDQVESHQDHGQGSAQYIEKEHAVTEPRSQDFFKPASEGLHGGRVPPFAGCEILCDGSIIRDFGRCGQWGNGKVRGRRRE